MFLRRIASHADVIGETSLRRLHHPRGRKFYHPSRRGTVGMMRAYIERFHTVKTGGTYESIHPKMDELMAETYGVMVYQEDVIKVAHHFAKLTLSEADILRR